MRLSYVPWSPAKASSRIVEIANDLCAEYAAQGYDLTLRQLYYQFVARDLIPNTQRSYKNLGAVVNRARMSGMLDWSYIVDRTRNLAKRPSWDSPSEVLSAAASSFKLDRWKDQEFRVEVWIEKDALIGVIEDVCRDLDVPFFSCRGYTSQSELWRAAQRQIGYGYDGQQGVIVHLGDHDPSGIDMTRDIRDRFETFGARVIVNRIALNWDQVERYEPPPNPTKLTDSRASGYVSEFGGSSWELDALDPSVLNGLVRETVLLYRDEERHSDMMTVEVEMVGSLRNLASTPWETLRDLHGGAGQ